MKYLKLRLSGVMQYFSEVNTTALRTTYNTSLYPTRNAVVGLMAAAFGYDRNSSKDFFDTLNIKYSVINEPSILNDFQTIRPLKSQSNYMNKFYNKNRFSTVSGSYKNENLIKKVQYLQNADFNVFVGADDDTLKKIYDAILNPVYSLYFGKRSCVPNKPIVENFILINEEELPNAYNCA